MIYGVIVRVGQTVHSVYPFHFIEEAKAFHERALVLQHGFTSTLVSQEDGRNMLKGVTISVRDSSSNITDRKPAEVVVFPMRYPSPPKET